MKLILLRHGEAGKNVGLRRSGESDTLTAKGVKQSVAAAEAIRDQKVDTIYCSSAERCIQTMDEILRIRDEEINIHFSRLLAPKLKKESLEKLKLRCEMFVDDLRYDHESNETILIVGHLMPLSMIHYLLANKERRLENGEMVEVELDTAKKVEVE